MNRTAFHSMLALAALAALAGSAPGAEAAVRVDVFQSGRYEILQGEGSVQVSLPAIPLSSGPGSASADELRGELHAFASSLYPDGTAASAKLNGELQFTVLQSEPVTAYLHTWLTGGLTLSEGAVAGGGLELMSIHRADNQYHYRTSYLLSEGCGPQQQPWATCQNGSAIAERVTLAIALQPGEQSVFVQAWLRASVAQRPSTADFGHSASAWLEVPDGVTWTSTTPGFLSLATPVPEPATTALWAGGLALLACWQRLRTGAAAA